MCGRHSSEARSASRLKPVDPGLPHSYPRSSCQGSRFATAFPVATSSGTDTWSCAMNQSPLIFRKHIGSRTQEGGNLPALDPADAQTVLHRAGRGNPAGPRLSWKRIRNKAQPLLVFSCRPARSKCLPRLTGSLIGKSTRRFQTVFGCGGSRYEYCYRGLSCRRA
jgi:hypothetical protein